MENQMERRAPAWIEWPTLAVAAAIYGGFGLLTWWYHSLPWWLVVPLGAYLVAWHGSLQHEVVHGHPTPWRRVNELLIFPSLWLWLPYPLYRDSHLRHHNDVALTDPLEDPESNYVTAEDWARLGPVSRAGLWALRTLAGRMALEPVRCLWRLGRNETRRFAGGDMSTLGIWALHGVACTLVLAWVIAICGIPVVEYLAFFVYPGVALALVRSFLEHRAREQVRERTAIVEAGPIMSLLYLNNNLHTLHHLEPGTPWYLLSNRYRNRRAELLDHNGGYLLHGYGEIAARYLFRPKDSPVHRPAPETGSPAHGVNQIGLKPI
jgi:fatty acid desaturase